MHWTKFSIPPISDRNYTILLALLNTVQWKVVIELESILNISPYKKKKKATSTYLHVWHYCPIKLYKRHMYTFSQCREAKHVHNTASATRCLHHIPVGAWGFLHGGETMWSALPAVPVLWRRLVWQNKFLGMSSHKDWALRWCYMQFYLVCKYLYYIKQL